MWNKKVLNSSKNETKMEVIPYTPGTILFTQIIDETHFLEWFSPSTRISLKFV